MQMGHQILRAEIIAGPQCSEHLQEECPYIFRTLARPDIISNLYRIWIDIYLRVIVSAYINKVQLRLWRIYPIVLREFWHDCPLRDRLLDLHENTMGAQSVGSKEASQILAGGLPKPVLLPRKMALEVSVSLS